MTNPIHPNREDVNELRGEREHRFTARRSTDLEKICTEAPNAAVHDVVSPERLHSHAPARSGPMSDKPRRRAPVVPNACYVQGELVAVDRDPAGAGSVWRIAVREARDVPGLPNFAASWIGKTIAVYIHPELETNLKVGATVQARVAYRGDERGGRFALVEDDFRRL